MSQALIICNWLNFWRTARRVAPVELQLGPPSFSYSLKKETIMNWRHAILAGSAAAALSLSSLGSVAEPDRGDMRGDRGGTSDRADRGDTADRGGNRADRADKGDRGARADRGDRAERGERGDKARRGHVDRDVGDRPRGNKEGFVDRGRDRSWRRSADWDRVRRGHRYNWGPGIGFYFSDGYYYGNCHWLKRRAIVTGNPLWWDRYHLCRDFS